MGGGALNRPRHPKPHNRPGPSPRDTLAIMIIAALHRKGRTMTQGTIRILDLDTKKVTTIPASELAPGMIRVKYEGLEGEFFVEAAKLKSRAPLRHPPFGE